MREHSATKSAKDLNFDMSTPVSTPYNAASPRAIASNCAPPARSPIPFTVT